MPPPSTLRRAPRKRLRSFVVMLIGIGVLVLALLPALLPTYYARVADTRGRQYEASVDAFMDAARNPDRVWLELYCFDEVCKRSFLPDVQLDTPEDLEAFAAFFRATEAVAWTPSNLREIATQLQQPVSLPTNPKGVDIRRLVLHVYVDGKEHCAALAPGDSLDVKDAGTATLNGFSTTEFYQWLSDAGKLKSQP